MHRRGALADAARRGALMRPAAESHAQDPAGLVYRVALAIALLVWLLPILGVALTSMRSIEDIQRGNLWTWPADIHVLENYRAVLANGPTARFLLNSLLITVPAVAGTVLVSCLAGFALAKHRFRGSTLLLALFVAGNFVPFQVLMVPVRDLMVAIGLYDTRWALILFHIAFQTGFCTLFMRNFMRRLPESLIETARMEGLGELAILWHVVIPLVRPAIAGVSVLIFTFVWNDYFWSLVLVHSDAVRPITAGLQTLRGMWTTSWNLIAAGAILAALPPVAIFLLMQRHFVAGLTLGTADE
jgi:multiple sugar transport system permease protein